MNIDEQVKELRDKADIFEKSGYAVDGIIRAFRESANTIESLSAKLQAANEELERWHTDHINEKIKNPFAQTSTLICHNCDHKDEYIEELEAEVEELKAVNMERSAEDCGGWIPCKERFPDEEKYYIVTIINWEKKPAIEYCLFQNGKWYLVADGSYKENTSWKEEIESVIAWCDSPEPYHEP